MTVNWGAGTASWRDGNDRLDLARRRPGLGIPLDFDKRASAGCRLNAAEG